MARRVLFQAPAEAEDTESTESTAVADRAPVEGDVVLDANEADSTTASAIESAAIRELVQEEGATKFSALLREFTFKCGEVTMGRLAQSQYLSEEDAEGILSSFGYYVNDLPEKSSVLDIVAFLIWIKLESKDEKAVKEIRNLTDLLKASGGEKIGHMGFAHLNDMPGALYEAHPRVFEICSAMMCPVIQNTESDFVTITSVNPVTASTACALVAHELERATGTRPFSFVLTTDSSAWSFLCEKHFGS